jgi:hypothetical protein
MKNVNNFYKKQNIPFEAIYLVQLAILLGRENVIENCEK